MYERGRGRASPLDTPLAKAPRDVTAMISSPTTGRAQSFPVECISRPTRMPVSINTTLAKASWWAPAHPSPHAQVVESRREEIGVALDGQREVTRLVRAPEARHVHGQRARELARSPHQ